MKKQLTHEQILERRHERREAKRVQAEIAKNAEKNAYHQQINDEVRKQLSPSDEIAILRHAAVTFADVLIQRGIISAQDVEELLNWNGHVTEIKDKVKAEKGE